MTFEEEFRITLRTDRGGLPNALPVETKLRSLLKLMLRGFGLRCVRIQRADGSEVSLDNTDAAAGSQ